MQTHFFPVGIPYGHKSRAWYATSPSGRAVVFVHGFGGDALKTWQQFPVLLPAETQCAGHDMYFYGYDSLRRQAAYSAAELRALLGQLLTLPADVVRRSSPEAAAARPGTQSYQRITVVAHSLGALVARRALLDLAQDATMRARLPLIRVVLFAPAHNGANVIRLASEALGFFRLPIASAARYKFPVLLDLDTGSQTLTLLLDNTKAEYDACVARNAPTSHVVAQAVMHAEGDKIVSQNAFFRDPPMTPTPGKGHIDMCKPSARYRAPIDLLVQIA